MEVGVVPRGDLWMKPRVLRLAQVVAVCLSIALTLPCALAQSTNNVEIAEHQVQTIRRAFRKLRQITKTLGPREKQRLKGFARGRDSDGDGVIDIIEQANRTDKCKVDTDGDGISDDSDSRERNSDSDEDGIPDGEQFERSGRVETYGPSRIVIGGISYTITDSTIFQSQSGDFSLDDLATGLCLKVEGYDAGEEAGSIARKVIMRRDRSCSGSRTDFPTLTPTPTSTPTPAPLPFISIEIGDGASSEVRFNNYRSQTYRGECSGSGNLELALGAEAIHEVACIDGQWSKEIDYSAIDTNGILRITASIANQDGVITSSYLDIDKITPVYPLSVWLGGGGFSFSLNPGYLGVPPMYARGVSWPKINAGEVRYEQKLATLNFPQTSYTHDISEVIDLVTSEHPAATLTYASVELAIVDSENRVFGYITANTNGAADPIKRIEENRVTIDVGDLPGLAGQTISSGWVMGENAWNDTFIFKALTPYSQPTMPTDDANFVTIGDVGNVGDSQPSTDPHTPSLDPVVGLGAVSFEYQIGKYLVSMEDYAEFLNSVAQTDTFGLYNTLLASDTQAGGINRSGVSGSYRYQVQSGKSKRPITYVSWLDAARYVNWLHNGKPVGAQDATTTESGAYSLNGATGFSSYVRSTMAQYFLPSEDEWYKAAFYKGGGTNAGYWLFANQSDTAPTGSASDIVGGASCDSIANGTTDIDLFTSATSSYGTHDQSGNAWQWLEKSDVVNAQVLRRGGSWANLCAGTPSRLSAAIRAHSAIDLESQHVGFRVGKRLN